MNNQSNYSCTQSFLVLASLEYHLVRGWTTVQLWLCGHYLHFLTLVCLFSNLYKNSISCPQHTEISANCICQCLSQINTHIHVITLPTLYLPINVPPMYNRCRPFATAFLLLSNGSQPMYCCYFQLLTDELRDITLYVKTLSKQNANSIFYHNFKLHMNTTIVQSENGLRGHFM